MTYSFYLIVYLQNLPLSWRTFAPHQITDSQTQKIRRRRPKRIFWQSVVLVELFANFQQTMDKPIQEINNITMQIFYHFRTKFPTNFLSIINIITSIFTFNLHLHYFRLHLIIILIEFIHKFHNIFLFLLQSFI